MEIKGNMRQIADMMGLSAEQAAAVIAAVKGGDLYGTISASVLTDTRADCRCAERPRKAEQAQVFNAPDDLL